MNIFWFFENLEAKLVQRKELIARKVKCCVCGGSLRDSETINLVCLMKEAEWKHPCWGNFLLGLMGFASAVVCDKCVKENKEPKYAVEWNNDVSVVRYHLVDKLVDVPEEIFEPLDLLEPGRHGVAA